MREQIIKRWDYHSEMENNENVCIPYVPYLEMPDCHDYKYGERRTVILKNAITGDLEEISFQLTGATPFFTQSGYRRYWGQIESQRSVCLVYSFGLDGRLDSIFAAFCGGHPATSALRFMGGGLKEWGGAVQII